MEYDGLGSGQQTFLLKVFIGLFVSPWLLSYISNYLSDFLNRNLQEMFNGSDYHHSDNGQDGGVRSSEIHLWASGFILTCKNKVPDVLGELFDLTTMRHSCSISVASIISTRR